MARLLRWIAGGLAITLGSVAVFILAAAMFPGDPGRFYLLIGTVLGGVLALLRLLGFEQAPDDRD